MRTRTLRITRTTSVAFIVAIATGAAVGAFAAGLATAGAGREPSCQVVVPSPPAAPSAASPPVAPPSPPAPPVVAPPVAAPPVTAPSVTAPPTRPQKSASIAQPAPPVRDMAGMKAWKRCPHPVPGDNDCDGIPDER